MAHKKERHTVCSFLNALLILGIYYLQDQIHHDPHCDIFF